MQKKFTLPTIWPVTCHTKHVGPGTTFVAILGSTYDGLQFVAQALAQGAAKIVVSEQVVTSELCALIAQYKAELIPVLDPRIALSSLSAEAWGFPAQSLKIIGVTGTKGKTTSVYALRHLLVKSGRTTAMLSGVDNWIGEHKFPAALTTPQADYLHMFLAQCVEQKIEYVVMEVSAQALSLGRVSDISLAGIIFTNFEMEHSEFYESLEAYFAAKLKIFGLLQSDGFVVLNLDDQWVCQILSKVDFLVTQKKLLFAANLANLSQDCAQLIFAKSNLFYGLLFELNLLNGANLQFSVPNLSGVFNVYNISGVVLTAQALGIDIGDLQAGLETLTSAPGRLEIYDLPNGARGVVDYAHTPSSFRHILSLLRQETQNLILVFGAGGGRDPYKRPIMGNIALSLCDIVILTNDNPRHEEPMSIVQQIIGLNDRSRFIIELDRSQAILKAYQVSKLGDIVVLLGKGPDEYQQIGAEKYFFSDREQLLKLF